MDNAAGRNKPGVGKSSRELHVLRDIEVRKDVDVAMAANGEDVCDELQELDLCRSVGSPGGARESWM